MPTRIEVLIVGWAQACCGVPARLGELRSRDEVGELLRALADDAALRFGASDRILRSDNAAAVTIEPQRAGAAALHWMRSAEEGADGIRVQLGDGVWAVPADVDQTELLREFLDAAAAGRVAGAGAAGRRRARPAANGRHRRRRPQLDGNDGPPRPFRLRRCVRHGRAARAAPGARRPPLCRLGVAAYGCPVVPRHGASRPPLCLAAPGITRAARQNEGRECVAASGRVAGGGASLHAG